MRRPTALLPLPGRPTRTRSIVLRAEARLRLAPGRAPGPVLGQVLRRLSDRISTELVEQEVRQCEADHRFSNNTRCRHDADVATLVVALFNRLAGDEIGRRERAGERRDRLDRAPDHDRLTV